MSQPQLFDDVPKASVRRRDPETSRRALRELPLRKRQAEVVDVLRGVFTSATADEVRQRLWERGMMRERNECASRLSELARMDPPLVRKVGVRRNHRGKGVATWVLTPDGRMWSQP